MALNYSNLVSSNSANTALQKKLNPPPIQGPTFLPSSASALASGIRATPLGNTSASTIASVKKQPTLPVKTASPQVQAAPVAQNLATTSYAQPSYQSAAPVSSAPIASTNKPLNQKDAAWDSLRRKKSEETQTSSVTYPGLVGGLVDYAKNSKDTDKAYKTALSKANNLKEFRESVADATRGIYDAPTSARVMQGRDQALQVANASKEAALGSELQAATDLYGQAITSRGQTLSALGTAAGYAQPVQVAPGSTLSSPLSGETVAGGLGGYQNYQTAQQVNSLISQYPDAGYTYDQSKTPQENLQIFQGQYLPASPTYQKSTYGVPGAQNVAGAAVTQAAQQGYNDSSILYQQMNSQFQNADGQSQLLLEALKDSGINASDARFANQTINSISRQLSSADLARFNAALKATQAAYGNLLVSGGGTIPTEATNAYNTILDPSASLSSFQAAINQLKREGQTKLGAQAGQVNTFYGQLQQGQQQSGGSSSSNPFATEW